MIPVIMSGGIGSRLWPYSRQNLPKQFGNFFEKSLMELGTLRFKKYEHSPIILSVASQKNIVKNISPLKDLTGLYEPMGRNTGPAIAFLCKYLEQNNLQNEIVGVFPADHLIEKEDEFHRALDQAIAQAKNDDIVTLGIVPEYPATGYGYIELDNTQVLQAHKVQSFKEKPDEATAQSYIDQKTYFWNAGIFIFKAQTMINALMTHCPDIWEAFAALKPDHSNLTDIYESVRSISIDFAVMENATNLSCVPCNIGWKDLGSWDAMANLEKETPGALKNEIQQVETGDTSNNFVFSKLDKTYAFINTDDLIVVDTKDALLLAKKGDAEQVKEIVQDLNKKEIPCGSNHPSDFRPWGSYETLAEEAQFKFKKITVLPGERLSYQSHEHRAEHWIIIEGEAEITLNDEIITKKTGEHIFIPQQAKHRIKNTSGNKLVFVEVQTGSYFGEEDTVRYQDDYGR